MQSRRRFLSVLGLVGTAGLGERTADAAFQRRRRRRSRLAQTHSDSDSASPLPSAMKPEFIQPDYGKWQRVTEGMHRDELPALLGEPLYRQDLDPEYRELFPNPSSKAAERYVYSWTFGRLEFASPQVPQDSFKFSIDIWLGSQTVSGTNDPFKGRFSTDGLPTVPRLIVPQDQTTFSHYSRLLDLRWEPSSGVYPIRYEVEYAFAQRICADGSLEYWAFPGQKSDIPYYLMSFAGKQRGRWHVRAENRLGQSDWSEYRYFEFTV